MPNLNFTSSHAPTQKQVDFVHGLVRDLHASDVLLDYHCKKRFGCVFRDLDRKQCSDLIEDLIKWRNVLDDFRRANGQIDLPGLEV